MSLFGLFFLFMYIGLSTIGGGLVAISLMQQELVSRSIISSERFIAMIAVSESTPGPIGINLGQPCVDCRNGVAVADCHCVNRPLYPIVSKCGTG